MAKAMGLSEIHIPLPGSPGPGPTYRLKPTLIGLVNQTELVHSVNVRIICYLLAIDYKTEVPIHDFRYTNTKSFIYFYRHYIC